MTRARDLSNLIGSGNYVSETLTATAGQTAFTVTNGYTPNFVQVFMNGLLLDPVVDYAATTSPTITLTTGANAGDELEVVKYNTFSVGDAITQTAADTRYVNASGDTMAGGLNVTGGNVGIGTSSPSSLFEVNKGSAGTLATFTDGVNSNFVVETASLITTVGNTGGSTALAFKSANTERMRIDSAGRVTMPYQPAFSASPTGSGTDFSYGLPDTPQVFTYVWYNIGNHYSTSTGRFTAPVSGYYHLWCGGTSYCAGRNRYITTFWYRNGSSFSEAGRGRAQTTGSGTEYVSPTISNVVYLNANDYIQLYTYGEIGASTAYIHSLEFNWGVRLIS